MNQSIKQKLNKIFEKFEQFKQKFKLYSYVSDNKNKFDLMKEFRIFLSSFEFEDKKIVNMIINHRKYKEYELFFREQNNLFMKEIEIVEALHIIQHYPNIKPPFRKILSTEYLKERYFQKKHDLRLVDFKSIDNCIIVGSGSFPDTIFHIYENTQVSKIIGLDYDRDAIEISLKLIKSLKNNRIEFKFIKGCEYDYSSIDLVYIAGFVSPKHEILKQIANTCQKPNLQIIVDSVLGMQKILYENIIEENIHPSLKILQRDYSKNTYSRQEMIKLVFK